MKHIGILSKHWVPLMPLTGAEVDIFIMFTDIRNKVDFTRREVGEEPELNVKL